ENQLQAELHGAAAARSNHRVRCSAVRRRATATELVAEQRRIVKAETILSAIRVGKIRMVQNIEKFGAELRTEALGEVPVLGNREIPVAEPGVAENIASRGSERSQRRWKQDRTAVRVAAKQGKRVKRAHGRRFSSAGRI